MGEVEHRAENYHDTAEEIAGYLLSREDYKGRFVLNSWRRYKVEYPDEASMILSMAAILFTPAETAERDTWISTFAVEAAIGQLATDLLRYEEELRMVA